MNSKERHDKAKIMKLATRTRKIHCSVEEEKILQG
jgi:hypothetical protein